MTTDIDITGLDKAEVLAALYNASKGGHLQYSSKEMTSARAQELLDRQTYFDYLGGRVMKVDLSTNDLYPSKYDRDNGEGAAAAVIAKLKGEPI